MQLHEISRVVGGGKVRLSGWVTRGGDPEPTEVYFEFGEEFAEWVPESADPFAIALLIPAMMAQEPLVITPPISPLLHRNLPEVRDVFSKWYPELLASMITSTPSELPRGPADPRAATFFSGGVDSFYTLLKRLGPSPLSEPLTHVIYMRGIETPLEESKGIDASAARVASIARRCGVGVVTGETNIRTFFKRHWERYYVGSGLSATAAALSGKFSTVCIPSGHSYSNLASRGSHPLTDPLFSTEACRIVHDGAEATRADKLRIALKLDSDLVRTNLRICIANDGADFNCGRCYKCVRTLVILEILGEGPRGGLFASVDRSSWGRALMSDQMDYNREALAFAQVHGADETLKKLLRGVINRRERFDAVTRLVKHSPVALGMPLFRALRDRLGISARTYKV